MVDLISRLRQREIWLRIVPVMPESTGDAGLLKTFPEIGDLTHTGVFAVVTEIVSNSLKFEARGVG